MSAHQQKQLLHTFEEEQLASHSIHNQNILSQQAEKMESDLFKFIFHIFWKLTL